MKCCFRKGLKCALFAALFVAMFSLAVMLLWNWLMPALFGWRVITFLQALGLMALGNILFGGFRGRRGMMPCRHPIMERWEKMTPEERQAFREGLRGHCTPCGPDEADHS